MSLTPLVPWWLWALLALALVGGAAYGLTRAPGSTLARVRLAMAVVLCLILAHPGVGRTTSSQGEAQVDILLVIDRTVSMSAVDGEKGRPRLDGVRTEIEAFAKAVPGARFAMLTFGRETHLAMPFTADPGALRSALAGLEREDIFAGKGSRPDRPIAAMKEILERDEDQHPDRLRAVLFFSDGEITESNEALDSFTPVEPHLTAGAVIGHGTTTGGQMPIVEDDPGEFIVDQATGKPAISRIDEQNLRQIAGQLGVPYVHSPNRTRLAQVAAGLDDAYSVGGLDAPTRHDLSWLLGLALGLLGLRHLRESMARLAQASAERKVLGS